MGQFDVFPNPVSGARRLLPFVILLQSDLADTGPDRVVAPLALRDRLPPLSGRLMPLCSINGRDHGILVPGLSTVRARGLGSPVVNLSAERDAIVAALDYLFLGF